MPNLPATYNDSNQKKIVDAVRTINDVLSEEVNGAANLQIPLLREYLKNVREVRMAFAEEVREVLRSTQQLSGITKQTPELVALGQALSKLHAILTPEFIEMLGRLAPPKD